MELTILGCATPFPRRNNPCSGYLLSEEATAVLIDCGSGVFAALHEKIDPNELSGVWISHLHPDHFADLPALANWALNTPAARKLPIFGPEGWDRRLNYFLSGDSSSGVTGSIFDIDYISDGHTVELGNLRLKSREVHHSVTGFGVRVTHENTEFAYSGDTGPCDALTDLAFNADLFLCEAGTDTLSDYHLTAQQACDIAASAQAGELLLTHTSGDLTTSNMRTPEGLTVGVAQPGDRWLIRSK